jgi:hypothetical protein
MVHGLTNHATEMRQNYLDYTSQLLAKLQRPADDPRYFPVSRPLSLLFWASNFRIIYLSALNSLRQDYEKDMKFGA